MTNKIDITKKYQTYSGRPVRIYCTDASGSYPVHGAIYYEKPNPFWAVESWNSYGSYNHETCDCDDDLVEYDPYSSFKEDDLVFYQLCNGGEWIRGYFSHVDNGIPKVFYGGRTSFTNLGTNAVSAIKHYRED